MDTLEVVLWIFIVVSLVLQVATFRMEWQRRYRSREFDDVREFQRKFGWTHATKPTLIPDHQRLKERLALIDEEVGELHDAIESRSLVDAADALVDIVYVVLGLAAILGLPWRLLWDDVHRANMAKQRGVKPERATHTIDVIKPPGWVGPKTREILIAKGWRS